MDFQFNSQEQKIQKQARAFAQSELLPHTQRWNDQAIFPAEILQKCAKEGLVGLTVPQEVGGVGESTLSYSLAIMELARGCSSFAVTVAVTSMVSEILSFFGTPQHHKRYLLPILSGEFVSGSFALSEPEAGSDAGAIQTKSKEEGNSFVVNGSKSWISSGTHSGVFVTWVRTEETPGTKGISTLLLEPGDKGFQIGRKEDKMGLLASSTVSLHFEDCKVPQERLLGQRGGGFQVAMKALDGGRIGVSSQAIGIATRALEVANRYYQTERNPSALVTERLQRLEVELHSARLLTWKAAWEKDQKLPFSTSAAIAKAYSTETANRVCQECVALLGKDGGSPDYPVEKLFRDCKVTTIYEGTSEVQRIVISRSLLR